MAGGKFCTSCGATLADQSEGCSTCGAAQSRECRDCGSLVAPKARFCPSCGAAQTRADDSGARLRLRAKGTEAASSMADTERRQVTVLFVDASNFTAVSKQLDSEDVYLFVDEAMALLVEVVSSYDGTVDKFTGDGLMALFGAPVAHEDDPERAVRAAWEMQRVIQPFRDRLVAQYGFEFRIRIGVHTGEVIAGRIGSDLHAEYTVIGETVNLAARLQTAAEPDSVCVSSSTYDLTAALFRYEPLAPLSLKGISEPVTAYRLAGVIAHGVTRRGIPGVTVPLVGREEPMSDIVTAFQRTIGEGSLRVVTITGEPGVGKTRLVGEFMRTIEDGSARAIVATGTAVTQSRPLSLAIDLVRALLGIQENDPLSAQAEMVEAAVRQCGLDSAAIAPYLSNLLGLTPSEPQTARRLESLNESMLQQQTFAAIRRLLIATAQKVPLVLVADDLHWTDAASREFIGYFLQSSPDVAMMLVIVAREDDTLQQARDAAPRDALTSIALRPLGRTHTSALLRRLMPGGSVAVKDVRREIATRSEGNPFFAEELVRTLLDRGVVIRDGNECRVTANDGEVLRDIPPTLRGLILARFDCLQRATRRVVQQASVLGRKFPARLLMQLSESEEDVIQALAELVQRQFLREEAFGLERGYAFSHALTQEAIHATILKRDRHEMHTHVAKTIEAGTFLSRGERDELLAYHWSESAMPDRAIPHLVVVAEMAARRYANDAAVHHCRRALAILSGRRGKDSEYVRIQLVHGRALKFLGKLADAQANLQEAIQFMYGRIERADADSAEVILLADLLRELADVKAREGQFEEAYSALNEAALLLAPNTDGKAVALRYALADRMAWVRFRQGHLDEALLMADRIARELESSPNADPAVLASLFNTVGGILWNFGKLDSATSYVRRSLALYHKIGYLFGKANAHTNLGVLYHVQGRWQEAAESYERSDFIRREIGYAIGRAANLKNLAYLRIAMGDHVNARKELEACLSVSEQLGEDLDAIQALMGLAHLAVLQERYDDAEQLIAGIRSHDLSCLGSDDLALLTSEEAIIGSHRRSPADAIQLAMSACELAKSSGVPSTEADCCRVLGVLHIRAGNREAAEQSLRQSLALAKSIGDPYRMGLSLLDLSQATDSRDERRSAVEEAMRIFTEIGASFDQNRALAALDAIDISSAAQRM